MLFNTIDFAIFLPIVFLLYWFVTNKQYRHQNILLLVASYFFYACWDYRFLFLLIFSTLLDFFTGLKMQEAGSERRKKTWFLISVLINLGFLGVFKYYNFFISSFAEGLSLLGIKVNYATIKVILPVGISFYTFHGLSYVIDIYKGRIKAIGNFIEYAVFVSYFPLLVAGPIERATHLLPQIQKPRNFNYAKAVDGLRQILWGLFKKIVVADNCAEFANQIFNHSTNYGGSTLLLGAFFFTFQIYADFSGYSDIALGVSRLFGIELLRNFAYPYFSRDIAEFWRRWHISLSSWFRDYLYVPLGGSRGGVGMQIRNTFIIFIVSGFWHGANWTFIVWGALNAIYFLPFMLAKRNRTNIEIVAQGKFLPNVNELFGMLLTFAMAVFAWIFFRAESISHAVQYISAMFSKSMFSMPEVGKLYVLALIVFLVVVEWLGREQQHALARLGFSWPKPIRLLFYYLIIVLIFYFAGSEQQFIYFQF